MSEWRALFQKPDDVSDGVAGWFDRIAAQLLSGSQLVVGGEPHRFVEVEFYYCGDAHTDTFTHRDPIQRECGRWYLHRTHGVYRGGSFKGFDLTFGDGKAFGGALIRGIEGPDGKLIDGPSLCVDYLLARTGLREVATLDAAIGERAAWDSDNPLRLQSVHASAPRSLWRSARVGLSLKRVKKTSDAPRFIMRPYRYLTEPSRTSKGKLLLVLALHAQGTDPETIRRLTDSPRQTIQRYIEDFEAGRAERDFSPYFGIDLGPKELCRLHGAWHANYGVLADWSDSRFDLRRQSVTVIVALHISMIQRSMSRSISVWSRCVVG